MKRNKPDLLIVLAIIFGLGILVTTYSQEIFATHIDYCCAK